MAATNRFDMLDGAILRPGRFDRLIEVPKPNAEGRERILRIHTSEMNLAETLEFTDLAAETEGMSGADLASLTTEAGMFAIRDGRDEVEMTDFTDAMAKIEQTDADPQTVYHY
jgi:proteasome regulatory subunit